MRHSRTVVALLGSAAMLMGQTLASTAQTDDLAPHVPAGANIVRSLRADVDGDGIDDAVAVYQLRSTSPTTTLGLVILGSRNGGTTPTYPLGSPSEEIRLPTRSAANRIALDVRDLDADGVPVVSLSLGETWNDGSNHETLALFRWDGHGFPEVLRLRGDRARLPEPDAHPGNGPRVTETSTLWNVRGARVRTDESYRWWRDGFRLSERAIALVEPTAVPDRPEAAVLAFYQAIDRGDVRAAHSMLGADFRARQPLESFSAGFRTTRRVAVEEVRALTHQIDFRDDPEPGQEIYVRIAATDDGPDGLQTRTFAGVWTVGRRGEGWQLERARIQQTLDLSEISSALPPGWRIQQTAVGNLRGRDRDDVVVLANPSGSFGGAHPFVIMDDGAGTWAVRVADAIGEDAELGGMGGSVLIEDVTGDGRAEIVYSSGIGAHGAQLWIVKSSGRGLTPLFVGFSSNAAIGLRDLDGDGVPEVIEFQSGYCGSYAGSPGLGFVYRWRDEGYRPATADFPDGPVSVFFQHPAATESFRLSDRDRACVDHMEATAHAFRGEAAAAVAAYRRFASFEPGPGDGASLPLPLYVGTPEFEAEARDLIGRGERLGWASNQQAMLWDLLGSAIETRAAGAATQAESATRQGKADAAALARGEADALTQQARAAYQRALALDPADPAAAAGLRRLTR